MWMSVLLQRNKSIHGIISITRPSWRNNKKKGTTMATTKEKCFCIDCRSSIVLEKSEQRHSCSSANKCLVNTVEHFSTLFHPVNHASYSFTHSFYFLNVVCSCCCWRCVFSSPNSMKKKGLLTFNAFYCIFQIIKSSFSFAWINLIIIYFIKLYRIFHIYCLLFQLPQTDLDCLDQTCRRFRLENGESMAEIDEVKWT